jgi:hypothetical protein
MNASLALPRPRLIHALWHNRMRLGALLPLCRLRRLPGAVLPWGRGIKRATGPLSSAKSFFQRWLLRPPYIPNRCPPPFPTSSLRVLFPYLDRRQG